MTEPDQLKFDPTLFGDGLAQEATEPTPNHTAVRRWRWPVVALLAGITAVGAAFVSANVLEKSSSQEQVEVATRGFPGEPVMTRIASTSHNVPVAIASQPSSWCEDSDALCTKLTTSKPVEALERIITTIPPNTAKQYRVQVLITPVEETPSE